jgi:hypothetical protein
MGSLNPLKEEDILNPPTQSVVPPAPTQSVVPPQPAPAPESVSAPVPVSAPTPTSLPTSLESSSSQVQTGSSTTRLVPTEKEAGIQEGLQKNTEQRIKLEEQAFQLKQEEVKAAQAKAQAEVDAQIAYEQERIKKQQEFDRQYQEKASQIAESVKAVKEFQFKDFFQDKGLAAKALAAIAVGLGEYGATLTGRENAAYKVLNNAIEMDFAKQQANLSKLKDAVAASKGDRSDLLEEYNRASTMLDASKAVAYEKAGLLYKQQLAKQGLTAEQISKDSRILDLKQKELEAQQKTQESLRANVTSSLSKGEQTSMKEVNPADIKKAEREANLAGDKRLKEVQDTLQGNEDFKKYRKDDLALKGFLSLRNNNAKGAAITKYIADVLQQGSFGPDMNKFVESFNGIKAFEEKVNKLAGGTLVSDTLLNSLEKAMRNDIRHSQNAAKGVLKLAREKGQELTGDPEFFTRFETPTPAATPVQKESEKSKPTTPETQNKWGSYKDGAK